ncbi:12182_t:CDS:2, partial [Cetraspora pellucida]
VFYEGAKKQGKMSYEDTMSICLEHPTEENEVHKLDPQIKTLREMVQKSREKTKILPSRTDIQDAEGQNKLNVTGFEKPAIEKGSNGTGFWKMGKQTQVHGYCTTRVNSSFVGFQDLYFDHNTPLGGYFYRQLDCLENWALYNRLYGKYPYKKSILIQQLLLLSRSRAWGRVSGTDDPNNLSMDFCILVASSTSTKCRIYESTLGYYNLQTKPKVKYDFRAMKKPTLDILSSENLFLNMLLAKAQKHLLLSSAYERCLRVL